MKIIEMSLLHLPADGNTITFCVIMRLEQLSELSKTQNEGILI